MWTRHASFWVDRGGLSNRWTTVSTSFSITRHRVWSSRTTGGCPDREGPKGPSPSYISAIAFIVHGRENASAEWVPLGSRHRISFFDRRRLDQSPDNVVRLYPVGLGVEVGDQPVAQDRGR